MKLSIKMKLKHWYECQIPLHELIINSSDRTGKDKWVEWPIGIGVQCNLNNIIRINNVKDKNLNFFIILLCHRIICGSCHNRF